MTDNPGTELTELLSGLTQIELTRKWIQDFSSVIIVSGEISQYLDSLEDAWRLYLSDVSSKLEHELRQIEELESGIAKLTEEEAIRMKLSAGNGSKAFRFFRRKSAAPALSVDADTWLS